MASHVKSMARACRDSDEASMRMPSFRWNTASAHRIQTSTQ